MRNIILFTIILILTVNAFKIGDYVCVDPRAKFVSNTCGARIELNTVDCVKTKVVNIIESVECDKQIYNYAVLKTQNGKTLLTSDFEYINDLSCKNTNLSIYYVHQIFDTGDLFDGSWASGPTSAAMALSYLGAIRPHPLRSSLPVPHDNLFGYYVWAPYSSFTGFKFARVQYDPLLRPSYGGFGHCTDAGLTSSLRVLDYITQHGFGSTFYATITFDEIKAALDQNHPVILSTLLTPVGNQIVVRGYTCDHKLIVNDPFGDATEASYGSARNGAGIIYSFEFVQPQWAIEVFPVP